MLLIRLCIVFFALATALTTILKASIIGTRVSLFVKWQNSLSLAFRYVRHSGHRLIEVVQRDLYDLIVRRQLPEFRYESSSWLENSTDMIRLLRFGEKKWNERVYTLESRHLNDLPEYCAISYTWGSAKRTCAITVNGKFGLPYRLAITANAYKALSDAALVSEKQYIWIDSICIDQDNGLEKIGQVKLMKEIYGGASGVLVWLETSYDAGLSMTALTNISNTLHRYDVDDLRLENFTVEGVSWDDRELNAFFSLLNHPWFSRVWIVQEVAMAAQVYISYGGQIKEWDEFQFVIRAFHRVEQGTLLPVLRLAELGLSIPTGIRRANIISALRDVRKGAETSRLEDLMMLCCSFDATLPRDKIYAFLGLSAGDSRGLLEPDYRKLENNNDNEVVTRDQEIFQQAAETFLYQYGSLQFLSLAGIGYDRKYEDLPSWVPDWSYPPNASGLNHFLPGEEAMAYRAAGNSHANFSFPFETLSRHLPLEGIFVDYIHRTTQPLTLSWLGIANSIGEWHERAFKLALSVGWVFYRTGEPIEEAFWRTLIGNRSAKQFPAPADCGESYRAWKEVNTVRRLIWKNTIEFFRSLRSPFTRNEELLQSMRDVAGDDDAAYEQREGYLKNLYSIGRIFEFDWFFSCVGRQFAVMKDGHMGIVPPGTRIGNCVCIFFGTRTPFVIRPCASRGLYRLVGDCYVHGVMQGELMEPRKWGSNEGSVAELFVLV